MAALRPRLNRQPTSQLVMAGGTIVERQLRPGGFVLHRQGRIVANELHIGRQNACTGNNGVLGVRQGAHDGGRTGQIRL